ncbi:ABC transporter permease [Frigidibacter sp. MR17.24]|uniref:ABC transporter permease n=1 Tax=Frigidibacter sp. MR17.24 TaxID=3127345 RepID=UPI003012A02B
MRGILRLILGLALAVALWQGLVWALALPAFLLPPPGRVLGTLWTSRGLVAEHAAITAAEIGLGLVLGTGCGVVLAIAMAGWPRLARAVRPVLVFTQTIPVFALAPLLTLWLGYGMGAKIVMAVLVIFFPVTSAFHDAILATPRGWIETARLMGASPGRILWHVRLPAALPGLASGLRLAAVYAPIGAVIGEWVGSSGGLGYLMLLANGRAKTDLMFAALLVLAAMTLALHRAVDALAGRAAARMRGERRLSARARPRSASAAPRGR